MLVVLELPCCSCAALVLLVSLSLVSMLSTPHLATLPNAVAYSTHRPYLLYFERSMIQQAQKVAASFVNEAERRLYQDVAPTLRLPYWDWANPYNSKA